ESFNPRARVGRDTNSGDLAVIDRVFQSTRPRGARRRRRVHHGTYALVSIHAPAWGATPFLLTTSKRSFSFNPRARVGRDVNTFCHCWQVLVFQSTRPRGARL